MTQKRVVWKFPINYQNTQILMLPKGTGILHFDKQGRNYLGEQLYIWAEVDPDCIDLEERRFALVGTGHPFVEVSNYTLAHVGSVLTEGGQFVWHLYEAVSDARRWEEAIAASGRGIGGSSTIPVDQRVS